MLGALFGALTIWLQDTLGSLFGGALPTWVPALTVLAGVNPLLLLLGRMKGFASVPVMFIAFATVFAVHLSAGTALPNSIPIAGAAALAMNILGVLFHQAHLRMTSDRCYRAKANPDG